MGVPCMPVRTMCLVIGRELHGALGTLVAVPPVPFTPSKYSLWVSAITTYYGMGDEPVANVIICGEPAVQKGADTKYLRPHVVIIGVMPPNVLVGPVVDLGFIVFVIAVGASKPVWGPTTVKVGGKSIAVMGIPYVPINPINQLICSDPCDLPIGLGIQMPSNVFAGMSLADYLLCVVSIAADMVISFLLNVIFGGIPFLGSFFGKRVFNGLARTLGRRLSGIFGRGLGLIFGKIAGGVSDFVGKQLGKLVGEKLGKTIGRGVGEMVGKVFEEPLKKLAGAGAGGLSPDGLLGFGNDAPIWER